VKVSSETWLLIATPANAGAHGTAAEPVEVGKSLLALEKFDFVWTMDPGLRRDGDQAE